MAQSDDQICRLCFSLGKLQVQIFNDLLTTNVADIIQKHFHDDVSETDSLPKTVCNDCWLKTQSFHLFYLQVKSAQEDYLQKCVKGESADHFLKIGSSSGANKLMSNIGTGHSGSSKSTHADKSCDSSHKSSTLSEEIGWAENCDPLDLDDDFNDMYTMSMDQSGLNVCDYEMSEDNDQCAECQNKRKELAAMREKYRETRQKYFKLCEINAENAIKIKDLLDGTLTKKTIHEQELFTPTELKQLRLIPGDKNKDSTFIKNCLEFLYKDDLSRLATKSVKGCNPKTVIKNDSVTEYPPKAPISPKKRSSIKRHFIARIKTNEKNIDSSEFALRVGEAYINRLLAHSIKNISNRATENRRKKT